VTLSCILTGVLDKAETIGDVLIGQSYKNNWNYVNQTVNTSYAKGDQFTFNYVFTAPIVSGNYVEKFNVLQSVSQSTLMCWQFAFTI
jgi:hypothetical protein